MARLPIVLTCRDRPVTHVTLYRDRAEVSRHLTGIAVEGSGPTVIQLKGVPQAVDLNSVRVELVQQPQDKQQFIIGDVSLSRLPSDPHPPSALSALDRQTIERRARLETLRQQHVELEGRREVVLYLVALTQEYAATQSTLKSNCLDPVAGFLDGFMPGHERALRDLAMEKVKLDADIKENAEETQELFAWFTRTGKSASEDPAKTDPVHCHRMTADEVNSIVLSLEPVTCAEEGKADQVPLGRTEIELNVSYMIDNASWTPTYDLFVTTNPDTQISTAQLQYRATVKQSTGEDWINTQVTLSTAAGSASWWQSSHSLPRFSRRWELNVKPPIPAFDPTKLSGGSGGFAAHATQSTVKFGVPSTLASSQPFSTFRTSSSSGAFGSSVSGTSATGNPVSGFGGFGAAPNAAVAAATSQAPLAAHATVAAPPAFDPLTMPVDTPSATVTSENTTDDSTPCSQQASHATHFTATFLLPFPATIRSDRDKSHRLIVTSIHNMPVTFSHSIAANSFPARGTDSSKFLESKFFECSVSALLSAHVTNMSAFTLVPTTSAMRVHLNGSPLAASPGDISFGQLKEAVLPSAKFSLNLGADRSVSVVRKPYLSRQVLPAASARAFSRVLGGGSANGVQDEAANRLGIDEKGTMWSVRYVIVNKQHSENGASVVRVKFDDSIPVSKQPQSRVDVISPSGDDVRVLEREEAGSMWDEERESDSAMARVYAKDGVVKFAVPVKAGETREILFEYLVVRGQE